MVGKGKFAVNSMLLVFGFAMALSGMILQVIYHLRGYEDTFEVLSMDRSGWDMVHLWCSIVFTAFAAYHFWAHWQWYKSVFGRGLYKKNRLTLLLTCFVLATAISGYLTLLVTGSGMVEIHDKLALFLLVIGAIHCVKRFGWYRMKLRSRTR